MASAEKAASRPDAEQKPAAPSISLPKGGGAIRGIGEKFAANPVTGTGSLSVPLATSPGRSGFGPQLSLSYDSGSGNGPFGFGWSLSLPAITRKTDKGLPRYRDAEESDVFVLPGAEDLVLDPDGTRFEDETTAAGDTIRYTIHRYRPRIEGLFARIERWTPSDGDVHWRSISKDNVLTVYGKDNGSRIFDPEDDRRIFSWLICETRDDKGNAILYGYKPEDGVDVDLSRAHERNRGARDDVRRTANRYLEHIHYGNREPLLDSEGKRPRWLTAAQIQNAGWMFEVVFDYGAARSGNAGEWACRGDPFSSYRAGFEVRTCRLCQRVLMFHHFADEPDVGIDCLVRSTDFTYSHEQDPENARNPVYTFLRAVTQTGYRRNPVVHEERSLPPVEFEYIRPEVQDTVEEVDAASLVNLPIGLDGTTYQWLDLHGEGIPGILTEQADGWFYKRNLSPISGRPVEFAPPELVAAKPNLALSGGQAQFMDLAGDGQPDLVVLDGPMAGLYEHDGEEGWQPFRPFRSRLNRDLQDPNLKLVDLDGDGHADVLISEDDAFVWHPSLAEEGFGPARRVAQALDEEKGPRLVFADGTQSIHLADLCGDGLTDLVRIRNGEVCYWPNLGHGRFGAKVTMDNAPWFDHPDQFDQRRIRLADVDGSGTTDILYLHAGGVRLYFNQSGNRWSPATVLPVFPPVDSAVSILAIDLLGNGTACLVWSSPLPGDARRPMRYVNLMGGQKPHLLVKTVNNLGAETRVEYAPSTKFYLQDKRDGRPWITRLPFPVHVVERVETHDRISRNRFVTRYAYHHGYFDGEEREFRGFGMVEQWDTEELAALVGDDTLPPATNLDEAAHVPPVLTRTWFHTGVHLGREHVSDFFASNEYYREPDHTEEDARALLLADTVLPAGLTLDEEREACRALKGSLLRQEVYALDGSPRTEHPYTVTEQNFTIVRLQVRQGQRHAVFFSHPREVITYHYERYLDENDRADPRIQHALTLEVDGFGNVLKEAAVGYGRRPGRSPLQGGDRTKQERTLCVYTENDVTRAIDDAAVFPNDYRTPLPCETRTFELTGFTPTGAAGRFQPSDLLGPAVGGGSRLIERVRTLYRKDDLTSLLGLRGLEPLALPGESYKLAFTPGLLDQVYVRGEEEKLLPADPADVLQGGGADRGGYVDLDGDGHWWIPSGRILYHPDKTASPEAELTQARRHFFLPRRFVDPFEQETLVAYDEPYNLLVVETVDAVENRVTAEPDYRVLAPRLLTDANGNRSEVAFDALGLVAATAVKGKTSESLGDWLDADFNPDLTQSEIDQFLADPKGGMAKTLLRNASTRIVYDLKKQPVFAATLARETHASDPVPTGGLKVQVSFSYSDGFGREIQKKIQAEPERVNGVPGPPRWVGSGWTIFNNKGKPVRQYEPFFSATHHFEFGVQVGVSPILFYDPVERVVATLHPDHTFEKVVFDPWQQVTWDVNDTVLRDPRTDADIAGYVSGYFKAQSAGWQTWHAQRIGLPLGDPEGEAAEKAADHADTPTIVHFDALGRPFLTLADNGPDPAKPDRHLLFATRVELDIEGNQREVIDAKGRIVMRYDYDLLGNRIHQLSMEAGARWMLNDVTGKPIRAWDSRGHTFRTEYDPLRRPRHSWVTGADPTNPDRELLTERLVYGEQHPESELRNLRGQLHLHLDQAGAVTTEAEDFKGNPLRASRRLTNGTQYRKVVDWRAVALLDLAELETALASRLEADVYTSHTTYDALNRPVTLTTPHTPAMQPNVIRPGYNEANLLERVDANLRGATANGQPIWTLFVTNIDYDAKGQRERIDYGNGVSTFYEYDPLTWRLVHLLTRRKAADFPGDCPRPAPAGWPGCQVQNLKYTYDPVGNITRIRDDAQQTIFFSNQRVEPSSDYTYDALYRLIEATGREHLGQGGVPIPHSHDDALRTRLPHPGDGNAMGRYCESYVYDEVGNILEMIHRRSCPGVPSWTRTYDYGEESLIEPKRKSNRLSSTTVGSANPPAERYVHDAHGNMIRMPHLAGSHPDPNLHWDYRDQLCQADLGGGGTSYYVYDASGQRVRKVWEKSATLIEERIYLDTFEIFRRQQGAELLERETVHIMDDKQHIALVETRTLDTATTDTAPLQLICYQFGNHLGSVSLELDDDAQIASYEEYAPYGSISYQAVHSQVETPNRHRFTGKEWDEESGLYYHGARYYATWLGRWESCESEIVDGPNLYAYGRNNPIVFKDPDGKKAVPEKTSRWQRFKDYLPIIGRTEEEKLDTGDRPNPLSRAAASIGLSALKLALSSMTSTDYSNATKLLEHYVSGRGKPFRLEVPADWQKAIASRYRKPGSYKNVSPYKWGMKDLQNSLGHFDLKITRGKEGQLIYNITDEYKFPPPKRERERHGFQIAGLTDKEAKTLQESLPTVEYETSGGFKEKWELKMIKKEWTLFIPQRFLDDMGVNFRVSGEFIVPPKASFGKGYKTGQQSRRAASGKTEKHE